MVKIQIKSEKLTSFGGIFPVMDTALSFKNSEIIAEKCLFYSEIP